MCQGCDAPASEAQHPQSEVGGGSKGAGQPEHPHSMEKTRWGRGGPAGQRAQKVRGDNKQGSLSRDRRGDKA